MLFDICRKIRFPPFQMEVDVTRCKAHDVQCVHREKHHALPCWGQLPAGSPAPLPGQCSVVSVLLLNTFDPSHWRPALSLLKSHGNGIIQHVFCCVWLLPHPAMDIHTCYRHISQFYCYVFLSVELSQVNHPFPDWWVTSWEI